MNLILMGKPGAGKGTQSRRLQQDIDFTVISTGDLIRKEIQKDTELGRSVKEYSSQGLLVPDEVVINILKPHLDSEKNLLFDGFPRTVNQAQELDKLVDVDKVIFLHVDDEVVINRIQSRKTVRHNNKTVSFSNLEDAQAYIDVYGGELIERKDDSARVIQKRLDEYQKHTKPVIEYYKKQEKFFSVDGSNSVEEVHQSIMAILEPDSK